MEDADFVNHDAIEQNERETHERDHADSWALFDFATTKRVVDQTMLDRVETLPQGVRSKVAE